jgi:hypothetical protein
MMLTKLFSDLSFAKLATNPTFGRHICRPILGVICLNLQGHMPVQSLIAGSDSGLHSIFELTRTGTMVQKLFVYCNFQRRAGFTFSLFAVPRVKLYRGIF